MSGWFRQLDGWRAVSVIERRSFTTPKNVPDIARFWSLMVESPSRLTGPLVATACSIPSLRDAWPPGSSSCQTMSLAFGSIRRVTVIRPHFQG